MITPRLHSELRETLRLALPLVLGQLSAIGMNVVDTVLAGHYDAQTLAAVAIGANVWTLAIVAAIGVMMAMPPTVAHLSGADERERIGGVLRQALWLAAILGIGLFFGVRHAGPLLRVMGIAPDIAAHAQQFLHAISWGAPALTGYFALRGFSEGLALTRPTMYFGAFGLVLLAPIGYVFMYGGFGLPARGAQGSGMATATVLWIQFIAFAAYIVHRRHYAIYAPFARWDWPQPRVILDLLRLGVPMGISLLMEAGLFVTAALLIGSLGADVVAGHQIAINVASVTFMVPLGLAMATTVRVGRAAGSGNAEGARWAGHVGIGASLASQVVSCALMALFPHFIAALYTQDTAVAAIAANLLLFAAAFQLSDGIQVTANGALRGLKDTTGPMAITTLSYWGIGMPVGYLLCFHFGHGASGMWVGMIAGLSVAAVLLFARFARQARHLATRA
ncbi:MAG: MATE family efflux transporter [Xanthomonadales bacterium PRO7]|nr:MATE family efflux transporter [Xanthomonadales bacterium PRO7]